MPAVSNEAEVWPEVLSQLQPEQRDEPIRYVDAHEARDVAQKYIDEFHPHLAKSRIAYLFRYSEGDWSKGGKRVLANIRVLSGLAKHLAGGIDAVMLIDGHLWESWDKEAGLKKREALVDHELCHLTVMKNKEGRVLRQRNGRPWLRIVGHDLEEFRVIVQRHGFWKPDLAEFGKAVSLRMDLERVEAPPQAEHAPWTSEQSAAILDLSAARREKEGLSDHTCECGCGEKTPIAKRTDTRYGMVKGQPLRFLPGHGLRRHRN